MPNKRIKNKVNKINANFVNRLKNPYRKHILDWESPNIATHKLSVGTDNNGNHFIYPNVQEINGKLIDFTRPPYDYFAGQDAAILRGDTVQVGKTDKDLNDAIKFTENYKSYYPKGNTFKNGGDAKHKIEAESGEIIQSNQPIKIKRGGMAVPLGNGFSLLKGRKHSQGGIDIDLQGDAKIWSSVPFLSGLSPAERVLDGENPDKVFAQQESYKDRYGIKDDGSKKRFGGEDEDENNDKDKNNKINLQGIKTTRNRSYNIKNIERIFNSLDTVKGMTDVQKAAILATIIEESGGDPGAIDKTRKFKGLLQWGNNRFNSEITGNANKDIDNQLNNDLYNTLHNTTDRKSWTHGGRGSGYNSGKDAHKQFINAKSVEEATHSFNRGYVRPTGGNESVKNRITVANQIYERIKNKNKKKMGGDINKNGLIYNLNGNVVQGLGYITSTGRRQKAKWGKLFSSDNISTGINVGGTIGSYLINKNMLDNMKLPQAPIARQAAKLKTHYNINPQLDAAREVENRVINNINNNTSSSNVALARINQARFANMLNTNSLYANKENIETELINQDRQNRQNISNSNIDNYNQYTKELIAAQNQINEAKSENAVSLLNNLAQGIQDRIARKEQRAQDKISQRLQLISTPNAANIGRNILNMTDEEFDNYLRNNKKNGMTGNDGKFYTAEEINKLPYVQRRKLFNI